MSAVINQEGKGALSIHFKGVTAFTDGAIGAIANPEGVTVVILRATFHFKTKSTGAANLDVGIGATATTKGTDILGTLAVGGAIDDTWYNGFVMQNGAKTAIAAPAVWAADKFVTFSGSADSSGLEGDLYLEYIRA